MPGSCAPDMGDVVRAKGRNKEYSFAACLCKADDHAWMKSGRNAGWQRIKEMPADAK